MIFKVDENKNGVIDFTIQKRVNKKVPNTDKIIETETIYNEHERALYPDKYEYYMDRTLIELKHMSNFEKQLELVKNFKHLNNQEWVDIFLRFANIFFKKINRNVVYVDGMF